MRRMRSRTVRLSSRTCSGLAGRSFLGCGRLTSAAEPFFVAGGISALPGDTPSSDFRLRPTSARQVGAAGEAEDPPTSDFGAAGEAEAELKDEEEEDEEAEAEEESLAGGTLCPTS